MTPPAPTAIGVIANPSSGRDMRRLLAWAPTFPTAEKINSVLRLLSAAGRLGVHEAWMLPDTTGIARQVRSQSELVRTQRGLPMPEVRLLDMPVRDHASDSTEAARRMQALGVRVIAVLGGDGTHRAVALGCGDVPLATLSTGTNNAFPEAREATLVGMATALLATGRVDPTVAVRRNKRLRVQGPGLDDMALVDVAVSRQTDTGAGAVWQGQSLTDTFASFAEPRVVGLSSVAGFSLPVSRDAPHGVHVRHGPEQALTVPLLPGWLDTVPIASATPLWPGQPVPLPAMAGTLALDGERCIEFGPEDRLHVSLDAHGPRTLMTDPTLAHAARHGLLAGPAPVT